MDIAVLINCATGDANEAADLVEYMNAPAGTNPRGGTAWADVRAANGHAAPYGIKYWEIGNEYYLAGQNYWLDPLWGNRTAYAQAYALGGSTAWVTNGVVEDADFSPSAMLGDGTANQVKFARYPPVDSTKAFTLYVNGAAWVCVTNLGSYGATSQVYTLDFPTGTIRFGDGMHGAKPANGVEIRLSYTCGRHDGFVDYDREMKEVDPSHQGVFVPGLVGVLRRNGNDSPLRRIGQTYVSVLRQSHLRSGFRGGLGASGHFRPILFLRQSHGRLRVDGPDRPAAGRAT